MEALAFGMVGFWSTEANPLGPVQEYVTPSVSEEAVNTISPPKHGESASAEAVTVLPTVSISAVF